jgi:hypothetical protein
MPDEKHPELIAPPPAEDWFEPIRQEWLALQKRKLAARQSTKPVPTPEPPRKSATPQAPMTPDTAQLDWGKGGRKIYKVTA